MTNQCVSCHSLDTVWNMATLLHAERDGPELCTVERGSEAERSIEASVRTGGKEQLGHKFSNVLIMMRVADRSGQARSTGWMLLLCPQKELKNDAFKVGQIRETTKTTSAAAEVTTDLNHDVDCEGLKGGSALFTPSLSSLQLEYTYFVF